MFLKRLARIFIHKKPSEPKPPPRDHLAEALLTRHIPLQKGSIEDIFAFCQETRKTLKIFKQAVIDLYVQWHNLEDKIDLLIQTHYHLKGHSKVTGAKKAGRATSESARRKINASKED